jgi:hypothetical protein
MSNIARAVLSLVVLISMNDRCVGADNESQSVSTTTTPTAPNNGTATGQKIGNIVSAAVSTAFPAISKIIDTIWPRPADRKTAAQATAALKATKTSADTEQKNNLADLKQQANNLAVTRSFVSISADVLTRISVMQALLSVRPAGVSLTDDLKPDEKARLQDLWGPAKTRIDTLQSDAIAKQLEGLSDTFLQTTFTDIRSSVTDNGTNITNQLAQGRTVALRDSLTQLAPKFANIVPLTAILIGDLGVSLEKAANNIAGAAGEETDAAAAQDRVANLLLILQTNRRR